jgi:hypothetical protein
MELTKTADTTTSISPFGALIAMFYEPGKTFALLEQRRHAWLPVILTMVCSSMLMVWYFSVVDLAWLTDQMNASITDAAAREQAGNMMTKGVMQGFALFGTLVGVPLVTAVMAVYFMIVAKSISNDFTFGTGFALAAWSFVPGLLALPLGAIQILLSSNGQIGMSELNPLSVNQLFFQYGAGNSLSGPLDMLSLTSIWGIALMVIGFQAWARVSRATALKVVLIPYVTIIVGWLAIALAMGKAA